MAELREELKKLEDAVIQQRDELRVKMHLAKADARDEWEKLEGKWDEAQTKFAEVKKAVGESGESIEAAARLLADELLKGYERIRKLF